MTFDWYKIFNKAEFLARDLETLTLDLFLDDIGEAEVLVTVGNELGVTYDGVFLIVGLNDRSPFGRDGYAVYLDASDDVWLGIEVPE